MTQPQLIIAVATLLGAAGMWLMLPRPSPRGRMAGVVLAAAGLGLLASQGLPLRRISDDIVFAILAGVTVVAAAATVTLRSPVYCAIWFGMTLLGTAGLLMFQGAQFLAVATVVVYAGAILVTFLFVLMLAQPEGRTYYDRLSWEALISATTGVVIIGILTMTVTKVLVVDRAQPPKAVLSAERRHPGGVLSQAHVARVGEELFVRHAIAVQVAGTLLLAALVGAAVIVARSKGPLLGPASQRSNRVEEPQ